MERTEIVSRLEQVFNQVFSNDSIILTDALTANDVDDWDSLSHMLLIAEVEQAFAIKFKLNDLSKMQNVGDMINIIIAKKSSA